MDGGGNSLGLAGTAAMAGVLSSLLYGVTPRDPWTLAVVTVLLAGVAMVASYLPARRAMQMDPMRTLRTE